MQYPNDAGSSQSSRYDKVVWNSEMERVFIELMHEEFITHRLQSSTFPPSVWARITDRMNSITGQGCRFTPVQLKGKLNRLRRAWRLLNDILSRGTGWGWDPELNTITDEARRLEELYRQRRTVHNSNNVDDEEMDGTHSGTPPVSAGPSGSGRRFRRATSKLHAKKYETMDRLNESLQGKIDCTGRKATESIERCVDELTKFQDLPDIIFTTALERFRSHSMCTIFLRLNDENKLRWLYSLGK
ncbi:UNVERIFIED_CONTAM: hypothetical protein Sindi_1818900 [Sesamum indicum]